MAALETRGVARAWARSPSVRCFWLALFFSSLFLLQHLYILCRRCRRILVIVHGLFALELSMRYETLTLGGNVIRFPIELRAKPSIGTVSLTNMEWTAR